MTSCPPLPNGAPLKPVTRARFFARTSPVFIWRYASPARAEEGLLPLNCAVAFVPTNPPAPPLWCSFALAPRPRATVRSLPSSQGTPGATRSERAQGLARLQKVVR